MAPDDGQDRDRRIGPLRTVDEPGKCPAGTQTSGEDAAELAGTITPDVSIGPCGTAI